MSRNRNDKAMRENLTSGLINVTDETFVEKFNRLDPQQKKKIITAYILAIIFLVLGVVIMIVIRNKLKNSETDIPVKPTNKPILTTPRVTTQSSGPGAEVTTTTPVGPDSPIMDRIRAEYPWTSPQCGFRTNSEEVARNSRVLTDTVAGPTDYPWMLAVINFEPKIPFDPVPSYLCGASLIAPHWALTAAQCCDKIIPAENERSGNFTAVLANVQTLQFSYPLISHNYRLARNCKTHPQRNLVTADDAADISLIRLNYEFKPLIVQDVIRINFICLPPSLGNLIDTRYEFSGYGLDEYFNYQPHKLRREVFWTWWVCELKEGKLLTFCRTKKGVPGRRRVAVCAGDLGGALVQDYQENAVKTGHFLQYGIASRVESIWAMVIERCEDVDKSIFVEVVKYRGWIKDTIYANEGP